MADIQNVHHITSAPSLRSMPRSREQIEKENLKKRREGYQRFAEDELENPLVVKPTAAGVYLSDADRFHTDVAGEERRRRDELAVKQQTRLLQKRDETLAREEKRWGEMAAAAEAEDARMERKRALGTCAKKNQPSLPFNPITLEYSHNYSGGMLQHADDLVRYRAALRTHNLYNRSNGDFNPITGAARADLPIPNKPASPSN